MSAKTILLEDLDYIDFQLFGISTHFSDSVQFIFHLNKSFGTQFQRIDDLDVYNDQDVSYYPIYQWEDVHTQVDYHIVKNSAYVLDSKQKMSNLSSLFDVAPLLIPQHKEYNFFLKVNPEVFQNLPIKENQFIQKITELDTSKIKTIDCLIF